MNKTWPEVDVEWGEVRPGTGNDRMTTNTA